jgi:hypothetical protein
VAADLTELGAAAAAPTKAGASGMGPDRTVSFWRGPDRSGSDLAVGHWAPIESVVNDDGPGKSVIIPFFNCGRAYLSTSSTSIDSSRAARPPAAAPPGCLLPARPLASWGGATGGLGGVGGRGNMTAYARAMGGQIGNG